MISFFLFSLPAGTSTTTPVLYTSESTSKFFLLTYVPYVLLILIATYSTSVTTSVDLGNGMNILISSIDFEFLFE